MAPKVLVRGLHKHYGATAGARGVDLQIEDGEIFGLIGPNGAGKTTTVECLVGLREPDEGQIEICGIDARRRPADVKEKIGAALQTTALQDAITPREALTLFGAFYAQHNDADTLLTRFSLRDQADAPFVTLSGGQRQRLALALAFVNNPEVAVLDEPTAGLDPHARRELHDAIVQMKRDGHTVLLTTHDLDEAARLCDRIAIIDHGRVIATGTPHELMARSTATQGVTFETTRPLEPAVFAQLRGAQQLACDGPVVSFHTTTVSRSVADLMALLDAHGAELTELHVQKATLEDVFIELTREATPQ